MACDTLVYEGKEYSREDFIKGITDGTIFLPKNARDSVFARLAQERKGTDDVAESADGYARDFKTMPFRFSARKIASGQKSLTVRPGVHEAGTYTDPVTGHLINVIPEGKMHLDAFLSTMGMDKKDFVKEFIGTEEARHEHIKEFLDNKIPLNIYSVRKVTSADDIIPEGSDPRFIKLHDYKKSIIDNLRSKLKHARGNEREPIRERIANLEEQMKTLQNEENHTFSTLIDMMNSDMDAVERVVNTGADWGGLDYANNLIYNYSNLVTTQFEDVFDMLDDDTKTKVMAMQARNDRLAKSIQDKFIDMGNERVEQYKGAKVPTLNGLPVVQKDIGWIKRMTLDSSSSDNPIVQTLTRIIKDAIRKFSMRVETFKTEHHKITKALTAFQKDAGLKKDEYYDYMLQEDNDGKRTGDFVGQLSNDYYETRSQNKTNLLWWAANHTFTANQAAWAVRKARKIEFYKNNRAHLAELNETDVKNGVTFDQKLDKMANKYAEGFNPNLMTAIFKIARENPGQLQDHQRESFKFYSKNGFERELVNGKYEYLIDMEVSMKWQDQKYNKIQALDDTDPRKVFYDHFEKSYLEGRQMLSDEEFYLRHTYIPEKVKNLGVWGELHDWGVNNVSQVISANIRGLDPITREPIRKIPVYMTADKLSAENKSYNLGSVLENFMTEAINHDEKHEIEGDTQLLLNMLNKQQIPDTNPDGSLKIINGEQQYKKGESNDYLSAKYRVEANLYDMRQDKEGVTNAKLLGTLDKRELKRLRASMENLGLTEDEKIEGWDHIANDIPYTGDSTQVAEFVEMGTKAKAIKSSGSNVTGSKIVNSLIKFTTAKLLAFNVFVGVSEIIQGWSTLNTWSAGNRFFNDVGLGKAFGDFFASTVPNSEIREKMHNISKYWGAHIDRAEQDNNPSNKLNRAAFAIWGFANGSTNKIMLDAMLRHESKNVTDKDGKVHSLWDVMHVDEMGHHSLVGNFGDNPFYNADGTASKYLLDMQHQFKEVLKESRDRATFEDPAEYEKYWLGRVVGQFKGSWLFNAFYARFGEYQGVDLQRGMDRKGFYRSFGEQFKLRKIKDEYGDEVLDLSLAGVTEMLGRVAKLFIQYPTWIPGGQFLAGKLGLQAGPHSELDQANLRIFMRELGMITTLLILTTILSGGGDDDKTWYRQYVINQLLRTQRDISMYMNPNALLSELKNPAPVLGTLGDFANIGVAAIQSGIFMDPYVHTRSGDRLRIIKAIGKVTPYANQYNNIMTKMNRTMSYNTY